MLLYRFGLGLFVLDLENRGRIGISGEIDDMNMGSMGFSS